MQIQITGLLNYVQTPIEEAWEGAMWKAGLEPREPRAVDLNEDHEGVIICRSAGDEEFGGEYRRWFDVDECGFCHADKDIVGGIYVDTISRIVNDTTEFIENLDFNNSYCRPDVYSAFPFENGSMGKFLELNYGDLYGDEALDQFLRDKGLDIPNRKSLEGKLSTMMESDRVGGYEGLFSLFLGERGY